MKLPAYFGHLTNNVVHERLTPGVKEELKRLTPRTAKGRHKQKLFQRLTEDVGNPKMWEHLASVVALMKISPDWDPFHGYLDKAVPRGMKHSDSRSRLRPSAFGLRYFCPSALLAPQPKRSKPRHSIMGRLDWIGGWPLGFRLWHSCKSEGHPSTQPKAGLSQLS